MNTTFVPSLFYAPRFPARSPHVPKWSAPTPLLRREPYLGPETKYACRTGRVGAKKTIPYLWPRCRGRSLPPTSARWSPRLQKRPGTSSEGNMKESGSHKRKPLTLGEVREAFEPLGE